MAGRKLIWSNPLDVMINVSQRGITAKGADALNVAMDEAVVMTEKAKKSKYYNVEQEDINYEAKIDSIRKMLNAKKTQAQAREQALPKNKTLAPNPAEVKLKKYTFSRIIQAVNADSGAVIKEFKYSKSGNMAAADYMFDVLFGKPTPPTITGYRLNKRAVFDRSLKDSYTEIIKYFYISNNKVTETISRIVEILVDGQCIDTITQRYTFQGTTHEDGRIVWEETSAILPAIDLESREAYANLQFTTGKIPAATITPTIENQKIKIVAKPHIIKETQMLPAVIKFTDANGKSITETTECNVPVHVKIDSFTGEILSKKVIIGTDYIKAIDGYSVFGKPVIKYSNNTNMYHIQYIYNPIQIVEKVPKATTVETSDVSKVSIKEMLLSEVNDIINDLLPSLYDNDYDPPVVNDMLIHHPSGMKIINEQFSNRLAQNINNIKKRLNYLYSNITGYVSYYKSPFINNIHQSFIKAFNYGDDTLMFANKIYSTTNIIEHEKLSTIEYFTLARKLTIEELADYYTVLMLEKFILYINRGGDARLYYLFTANNINSAVYVDNYKTITIEGGIPIEMADKIHFTYSCVISVLFMIL